MRQRSKLGDPLARGNSDASDFSAGDKGARENGYFSVWVGILETRKMGEAFGASACRH